MNEVDPVRSLKDTPALIETVFPAKRFLSKLRPNERLVGLRR